MSSLDERYLDVIKTLSKRIDGHSIPWALTGSTGFALQGVPLSPDDIDVQTTEEGADVIEEEFAEHVIDPVSFLESEAIRSHFGVLKLDGIRIEIMGALQKRQSDGTWGPPVDITEHRIFAGVEGLSIPVLSLRYEAKSYEQLGRSERAALLSKYAKK